MDTSAHQWINDKEYIYKYVYIHIHTYILYMYIYTHTHTYTIYTMEYYLVIRKKDFLPFLTTWVVPGDIILSEINQTETNTV